jgi:hypothetical protein
LFLPGATVSTSYATRGKIESAGRDSHRFVTL